MASKAKSETKKTEASKKPEAEKKASETKPKSEAKPAATAPKVKKIEKKPGTFLTTFLVHNLLKSKVFLVHDFIQNRELYQVNFLFDIAGSLEIE